MVPDQKIELSLEAKTFRRCGTSSISTHDIAAADAAISQLGQLIERVAANGAGGGEDEGAAEDEDADEDEDEDEGTL